MLVNSEIQKMRKKVGRPSKGGPGHLLQMRLDEAALAKLDDWRREQQDLPSRQEAIRRLIEQAVSALSQKGGAKK